MYKSCSYRPLQLARSLHVHNSKLLFQPALSGRMRNLAFVSRQEVCSRRFFANHDQRICSVDNEWMVVYEAAGTVVCYIKSVHD